MEVNRRGAVDGRPSVARLGIRHEVARTAVVTRPCATSIAMRPGAGRGHAPKTMMERGLNARSIAEGRTRPAVVATNGSAPSDHTGLTEIKITPAPSAELSGAPDQSSYRRQVGSRHTGERLWNAFTSLNTRRSAPRGLSAGCSRSATSSWASGGDCLGSSCGRTSSARISLLRASRFARRMDRNGCGDLAGIGQEIRPDHRRPSRTRPSAMSVPKNRNV